MHLEDTPTGGPVTSRSEPSPSSTSHATPCPRPVPALSGAVRKCGGETGQEKTQRAGGALQSPALSQQRGRQCPPHTHIRVCSGPRSFQTHFQFNSLPSRAFCCLKPNSQMESNNDYFTIWTPGCLGADRLSGQAGLESEGPCIEGLSYWGEGSVWK